MANTLLIWINAFVYQVLPPHWRDGWKQAMLSGLMKPMQVIYDELKAFESDTLSQINLSSQVIVVEELMNRKAGNQLALIYITDGTRDNEFVVNIPTGSGFEGVVNEVLKDFRLAGTQYILNEY